MRFEEKLSLGITAEEVANTEAPENMRPNHRAIFDAIKKFLDMDIDDVYDFATSGGSIEEGIVIISGLPEQILLEEIVGRTVHTGNYTRILEIIIDKVQPQYRVYIIVKLGVSDEKINASIRKSMANWKQGNPFPDGYYNTEDLALKAMGDIEDRLAQQAPVPIKPSAKPISKKKPSLPVDIQQVAIQMATKMGKEEFIPDIKKMTLREIRNAAKKGKEVTTIDMWTIAKIVFLGFLGIQTLYQGAAGIAALIIGLFAIFWIEHSRKK